MPPEDHKNMKKIQCWISIATWEQIAALGYSSPTIAVNKAFDKLLEDPRTDPAVSPGIPNVSQQIPNESPEIPLLKARLEELEKHNETLVTELKRNEEHQQNRIEDLKNHIFSLDNQLRTKDDQLEKLNENMHKQAVHLQTLLNQKAIEASGAKKPWWQFW
jgi:hypothetical protein